MADREHLSIGEVLTLLHDDFPDITVSKIRFLESRGLIAPERTPSGYRKFYENDVARLRWILTQQKVNFLPLKVIRERLDADDFDPDDLDGPPPPPTAPADSTAAPPEPATAQGPTSGIFEPRDRTLALSLGDLAARAGLTVAEARELERLGMIVATRWGDDTVFDDEAVAVAEVAARFKAIGVDGRHLRMYKLAAEREAGLYEQLVVPLLKRPAEERTEAVELLEELAALGHEMRTAMLRLALRPHLGA